MAACTPYDILQLGTFTIVSLLLALYFTIEWARSLYWRARYYVQRRHPKLYSRIFK